MAKTKEELNQIKKEVENLANVISELSDEELEILAAGSGASDFFKKIGEAMKNIAKPILK